MPSFPPERSSGTKFLDSLFSGAPHGLLTSDEGLRLKYLEEISRTLDRHLELTERSLATGVRSGSHDAVQYLPQPEVIINTDELVRAQQEVAGQVAALFDAQQDLIAATRAHTPLYKRMISNQGIAHGLLDEGNRLSQITNDHLAQGNEAALRAVIGAFHQRESIVAGQHQSNVLLASVNTLVQEGNEVTVAAAVKAFEQRNAAARTLARSLAAQEELVEQVGGLCRTVPYQAELTRRLLHTLLADLSDRFSTLAQEQALARMSTLQSLYRLRSAFLRTHEQVMWTHQQQRGVLERILEAVEKTDSQRESRRLWKKAERLRQGGSLEDALAALQQAHALDDSDPLIYVSTGTIHATFGNDERAAFAFAEADALLEGSPSMTAFSLLNLAACLHDLGRHEHAERALRRATKSDPLNPEVWFHYGKTRLKAGMEARAVEVLRAVLGTHPDSYRPRVLIDPELQPVADRLEFT